MAVRRMDHVGIVVADLALATEFFVQVGLRVEGEASVEGEWVDGVIGLEGVRSQIVMLETPDGHGRIELSTFQAPPSPTGDTQTPANAPGIRHIAFEVDDLDATLARLHTCGAEVIGDGRYQDIYRLCYLRGPEGVIVELAERLS